MFETLSIDLFELLMNKKVYPFRLTDNFGEVHFGYMTDEEGNYIGTSEKPDEKEWIKFRYGVEYIEASN